MGEAYIVAAVRTAGGRRGGRLKDWHPADLGAAVLDEIVGRTGVDPAQVDDVILGCVTQVGQQAYNIARTCILVSKLPETVPGVTVDRQCGSSQQAIHFAAQAILSGSQDMVIAGGVESMTRVPILSSTLLADEKGMGGPLSPGLLRKRPGFAPSQFTGAELLGKKYGVTREHADAFALSSHQKAISAIRNGCFNDEIMPIAVLGADGMPAQHQVDEGVRFDVSIEAIRGVKLIQADGIITAATSSQICDGASAVMIVSERILREYHLEPLARIRTMTVLGDDPSVMLEGPIPATRLALKRAGLTIDQIDLFEVNEAFATVPLAWIKALDADPTRVNVNGGAIALGHPLGASGAKLATTLVHALRKQKKRAGLQTMCEGGGLANVTIFEIQ